MKRAILCDYCKFRKPGAGMRCDAFPEGVPDRFRFGREVHIHPTEGDHGIQFQMAKDLPEACETIALRMVAAKQEQEQAVREA